MFTLHKVQCKVCSVFLQLKTTLFFKREPHFVPTLIYLVDNFFEDFDVLLIQNLNEKFFSY